MADLRKIEKYLRERKLPYDLVDLAQEAFTVADVVDVGIKRDEVVKTLVIRVQLRSSPGLERGQGAKFVALALLGGDRIDFRKVRKLFGSKTELAKPDEVLKVVGVPVGAVCPILVGVPLYLDEKVLSLKNVHMGSGDLKYGLEMKLGDLLKAIGKYEIGDFAV